MRPPKALLIAFLALLLASCHQPITHYVDPLIGTGGHGHTYPGAILPFGAVQVSPDTRLEGWDGCSGYHHDDDTIYGFTHTHLSGTGCSDYGDVLLMPFCDDPMSDGTLTRDDYLATFSHRHETATPGYYKVILAPQQIQAELTVAPYTGYHRYTFSNNKPKGIAIDLNHRDVLTSGHIAPPHAMEGNSRYAIITGWRHSAAWNPNQKLFFAIAVDRSHIMACDIMDSSTRALIRLKPKVRSTTVAVALSAVDERGALENLQRYGLQEFDATRAQARKSWEEELSKIEVETHDIELKRNFYTALYHCMTAPYLYSDPDGRYRGMDDSIHHADPGRKVYTVFSLWDTYRTLHPLLALIDRQRTADFAYTMLQHYRQGGELTMWELAAHETHCMIGYHSASVLLDALQHGIMDSLVATLPATHDSLASTLLEEYLNAMTATANKPMLGRTEYARDGYLSSEHDNESVSKTLEYAYDDWCIAEFAKAIGDTSTYRHYRRRATAYRHLMDPNGFMHPKRNGAFITPFNPTEVNNHYTEANSWQYSTYVPHDIANWIALLGGKAKTEAFLDSLFHTSATLSGRNQADITGLIGQYAHGNEPSHHAAYLYAYLGKAYKTQELVRQICTTLYDDRPDGLCGNEDCGQMSAWFVMSAMGFYPVCPGSTQYIIGSPMFDKVTIHLENGKQITITCHNQANDNCYIRSSSNGNRSYLSLEELRNGADLHFTMSGKPNPHWGGSPLKQLGQQGCSTHSTPTPCFNDWQQRFKDSICVAITTPKSLDGKAVEIYYTLDGSTPTNLAYRYTEPITLWQDAVVKAVAYSPNSGYSHVATHTLTQFHADKQLTYTTRPEPQYAENGEEGLIDRLYGTTNYRVGGWQGWAQDLVATVDLLESKEIHTVGVDCLEEMRSWIFFPASVVVEVSDDGKHYRPYGRVDNTNYPATLARQEEANTHTFSVTGNDMARYVKIHAVNYGKLPKWHISAGEQAWLFADEIVIE